MMKYLSRKEDAKARPFLVVFLASTAVLFLISDRVVVQYDEGIMLVGAMRVLAGQVLHRDIHFFYGPLMPYLLAGLFKLFGPSVLISRLCGTVIQGLLIASIYTFATKYCRRIIALLTALVCMGWLYGMQTEFQSEISLLALLTWWASVLMLPVFTGRVSHRRMFAAGVVTGLATLCRWDAGIGLIGIFLVLIPVGAYLQEPKAPGRVRAAIEGVSVFVAGVALLVLPVVFTYLAVAPAHDFLFDLYLYPKNHYKQVRNLPWPAVHSHTLFYMAAYLPIVLLLMTAYMVFSLWKKRGEREDAMEREQRLHWTGPLVMFALIAALMFMKAYIRLDPLHLVAPMLPTALLAAMLYEKRSVVKPWARFSIVVAGVLIAISALSLAEEKFYPERKKHTSVAERIAIPGRAAPLPPYRTWCDRGGPFTHGFCYLLQDNVHYQVAEYIADHTGPSDYLFVGLQHHDVTYANDMTLYFATYRLPATKWAEFDPMIVNTEPIQREMIGELERTQPPFAVLDSSPNQWSVEKNDGAKSTGVHLLDDYLASHYRVVQNLTNLSVLERNGVNR